MNAIGNNVGGELRVGQHFAKYSGIAMIQRAHGVKRVRGMACTCFDAVARSFKARIGMPKADANSTPCCFENYICCAFELRSNCHHSNMAARSLPEALERGERRRQ